MIRRIYPCLLAPFILLVGVGAPAFAQTATDPASHQEGFECIIDLSVLPPVEGYTGPTSVTIVPPTSGSTSRLCTGSAPNENIKLRCDATIANWPAVRQSASGFTCMIDTDSCDVPGRSGLVEATKSQLSVGEDGSATLACFWQP